ncbi:MAG: PadR family transcriptional regulator [Acidimicrobiia bacterium]|jgi:DNA-binding PadR family transcriptional regulator
MLEIAVLGLLKEQPLHGYELKKRLSETLGFLWGVSYGSLYPALRRLEREGAIEVVAQPTDASAAFAATGSLKGDLAAARRAGARTPKPSRRTRKAYRITERGDVQFEELLLADDPHADEEKLFALKLAFCAELPPEARLGLLERRRLALVARLDRARRSPGTRDDRYSRSLVEHRTRSTQRDLEWVEELIAAEQAGAEPAAPSAPAAAADTTPEVTEDTEVTEVTGLSEAPEPQDLQEVQEGATR